MIEELDLDIQIPSADELLKVALQDGKRFFSKRDSARILGITVDQAGDLITLCRLDAFLIDGEYRIHWTAIDDFINGFEVIRHQYLEYSNFTQYREVRRFFQLRRLIRKGGTIDQAKVLLRRQNISPWLIWEMADRRLPKRDLDNEEKDLQDWYDLPSMELPQEDSCQGWADLIGVKSSSIGSHPFEILSFFDMYDWFVEREVVNLPIPYRVSAQRDVMKNKDYGQLLLF
ncbi:hypothetical protein [uncultured Sphaerochaeta sp.]|uniref:hypothetical protein n=1 Tax=uncultured Sphaerochaeta sp. TaxID=886478 RepID=UPI002A0A7C21|nr:hypothetical protein [uncultured Sphaerochaeta sp.]